MSEPLWDGLREGCGTCHFAGPPSLSRQRECRRQPPVVLAIRYAGGDGGSYDQTEQCRPWMAESDWCGDYKRKMTDVPAPAA